jgi:hypothetical protein
MKKTLLTVSALLVFILAGCGGSTPTASATSFPTLDLPVLDPSPTPEAASPSAQATGPTSTSTPDLSAFAQMELKNSTGFSVQIPQGLIVTRPEGGISALGKGYLFGFFFRDFEVPATLEDAVAKFFDELAARDFVLEHGDPYKVTAHGKDGLAADFTGHIGKQQVAGQVLVYSPIAGKVFLGLGMNSTDPAEQNWEQTGRALFQKILDTVTFGP